jgi:hypothetical protein
MSSVRFSIPLAALLALAVVSCSGPGTRVRRAPVVGVVAENLSNPEGFDVETFAVVAREGLIKEFHSDPAEAVRVLRNRLGGRLTEAERADLAGLCAAGAGRVARRNPAGALGLRLAAAEFAWPLAIAKPTTSVRRRARAIYNHECGAVAEELFKHPHPGAWSAEFAGPLRTYRLRMPTSGAARIDPSFFDTLTRSDRMRITRRRLHLNRHRVEGLGSDLVGYRKWTSQRAAENPLLAPSGLALPLNAVLDFSRGTGQPDLVLRDMTLAPSAIYGGRSQPLSSDSTAALATLLDHMDVAQPVYGIKSLLFSPEFDKTTGIYQLEPWRPHQIPVILVHGLMSSPATWLAALNELQADPALQSRYQFLVFRYPTGYPIAYTASVLRRKLREMKAHIGPRSRDPEFHRMILVGHSMGGVLSDLQIRSSGEEIRKVFFHEPLDELALPPDERRRISEIVHFKANPDIRRAVFVTTPHRGSKFAANPIGNFASRMIHLPVDILTLGMTRLESFDGTTPFARQVRNHGCNGIKALRPDSPILAATLRMKPGPGVVWHSIIGELVPGMPPQISTDGVVPYWSSHLDDAQSEKIIVSAHTAVPHDSETIEELRRILYLHCR